MAQLAPKYDLAQPEEVRLRRRGAARRDAPGVQAGDRHRAPRRPRLDRDDPHLRLARGRQGPAGRDRLRDPRLSRDDPGRRRQPVPAGHRRPARGEGADRLQVPRRRPAAELRPARLERHRRRLPDGRRRLLLLPGAHRRHDHLGRLQHRRARGRVGAARAPRGRGVRRRRRAGRGARDDREGLRRAEARLQRRRRDGEVAAGPRQGRDRAVQVSARGRVPPRAAAHRDRASCSASSCGWKPRRTPGCARSLRRQRRTARAARDPARRRAPAHPAASSSRPRP